MKYYLFTGETHYPNGGAGDFAGKFDTLDEATRQTISQWAHVADENMKQVAFWHYHGRWDNGQWIDESSWELGEWGTSRPLTREDILAYDEEFGRGK